MKRLIAWVMVCLALGGCAARAREVVGVWKYRPITARQPYFILPGPLPGENETSPLRRTKPDPAVKELNARLSHSTLTLYPDHTFVMTIDSDFEGKWKLSGQNLLLKPARESGRKPIAFSLSDDNKTLSSVPEHMGEILVTYWKVK